jgi:hypothetical protein
MLSIIKDFGRVLYFVWTSAQITEFLQEDETQEDDVPSCLSVSIPVSAFI